MTQSLNRRIFRLALPNIVSNISVPLLGLVDAALMGREENAAQYLSAIALAGAIFSFVYWGFGFLRMGTTGMTAQAWGAENKTLTASLLGRALLVAGLAAVIVLALQVPIAWLGFQLVDGSPESTAIAREYFFIRIWAAPATISLYAFHGWFLGVQNAVFPMILSIFVNIINIGFNFLFVVGLDWDAEGIAMATVLAQYSGLILAVVMLWWKYPEYPRLWKKKAIFIWGELQYFFKVNLDIFIRTICLIFSFSFFVARSGDQGDELLAANNLLYQLMILMSYVVDGFSFAGESLIGNYAGKRDKEAMKKVVRGIFIWGMGMGVVFAVVYLLAGESILYLLTDKASIVKDAAPYIVWLALLAVAGPWPFIWDGLFLGVSRSRPMRNTMAIATFAVFVPAVFILQHFWGNHGLWMAMILFMLARGLGLQLLSGKIFQAGKSLTSAGD